MEKTPEFGEPLCMDCGKECDTVEFINNPLEMWCYCKQCDVDTFHPQLNKTLE